MYALDTNTVIHALKGIGRARQRLELSSPADVAIPALVLYELRLGTLSAHEPKQRQSQVDRLISLLTVLPFNSQAAEHAARVRFELERSGRRIGPLDILVAGSVLACGAILVTHNVDEFSRVSGLQIEDWY